MKALTAFIISCITEINLAFPQGTSINATGAASDNPALPETVSTKDRAYRLPVRCIKN